MSGRRRGVRTLVLRCPAWPVVAAGGAPGAPAAVFVANRAVAVSAAAAVAGVEVGQRRREAQARCPELAVLGADPARDARAFEPVASALDALTPLVELSEPGVAALATRGPSRYHGGDEALARRVLELARAVLGPRVDVGGPPGVGVADGPFAAGLAARAAARQAAEGAGEGVLVVPPGEAGPFLAPLPVAALGRPELADLLGRLGLATLGAFAALPPASVLARFGHDGARAHALAGGDDDAALDARPVPPDLAVAAELDPPAERVEAAAFVAKALADELHARLAERGLACTRVVVEAETEHGESLVRLWRHDGALSAPAVAERVRWQLDGWLTSATRPTAGVARLRLLPDEVHPDTGRQLGFWGGQAGDVRAARALARAQGLLGPGAVVVPERRGGRGPGEQVALIPVEALDLTEARPPRPPDPAPWPGRVPAPSPAVVHAEPPAAQVLDAAGRPVGVSGRGLATAPPALVAVGGGPLRPVVAWAGPWLADERWWDEATRRRRARFQAVTDDGAAHLLALEGGAWQVEATYG